MADEAGRIRTCIYCGRPIPRGKACGEHKPLLRDDPLGESARRPIGETELGLAYRWPAGEAVDDGDEQG